MSKEWKGTQYDASSGPTEKDWELVQQRIKEQCERGLEANPIVMSYGNYKAYLKAQEVINASKNKKD